MSPIMSESDQDLLFKQAGFDSAAEFHRMVASVDLSTPDRFAAFKRWQEEDGTKQGLSLLGRAP